MITKNKQFLSDLFFEKENENQVFASNGFKRLERFFEDICSQLVDIHLKHGVRIHFLRVPLESSTMRVTFSSAGTVSNVLDDSESGTILLRVNHEDRQYTVWLPSACGQYCFDKHRRITVSDGSSLSYQWEFNPNVQLNLLLSGNVGDIAVIPYVTMEDPDAKFFEELGTSSDIERHFYRKTDWFFARNPSDVWNYLINGSIYDPRSEKGIDKRFRCQQCAYAWWSYFGFLHKETGKKIYDMMQDEVAYSVLLDLSEEGEWGHGYWSDEIETHTRFHIDGVHLLISQYEKTADLLWLEAAKRSMAFIYRHLTERFDDGSLWFLHDTIEHSIEKRFKSVLFGKSQGNSLCINTHVQVLTALYRLGFLVADEKIYSEMFKDGLRALKRVLDYQPGEGIYKFLTFLIIRYKTMMPGTSIIHKLRNSLECFLIPKIYWLVRCLLPRLVYPGGFTERDLGLSFFSDRYHVINIKDFLTLYQQEPLPWLRAYIKRGVEFILKYLAEVDLKNALESSLYYIELIDVLYMYDKLIERVPPDERKTIEEIIYQQTGGYSLDYYASELVRGK